MKQGTFFLWIMILSSLLLSACKSDKDESLSQGNDQPVKKESRIEENHKKMSSIEQKELPSLGKEAQPAIIESTPEESKEEKKLEDVTNVAAKVKPIKEKRPPAKPKVVPKTPKIEFSEPLFNFGEIEAGDKFDHKFEFKNSGNAPLIIEGATATCGCTVPSYPFLPIEPGEKGFIGVNYNSVGKSGHQTPTITVLTNAISGKYILTLKGDVNEKNKEE